MYFSMEVITWVLCEVVFDLKKNGRLGNAEEEDKLNEQLHLEWIKLSWKQ